MLDSFEARHGGGEGGVEEDHAVFGVADDVAQVVLEKADVERVQDGAHRRHREVELEVAARVPAEGRDAVAGADPESLQRRGQATRAGDHLAVGGTLDGVVRPADHLAAGEQLLGALGDAADQQRALLHQPRERQGLRPPGLARAHGHLVSLLARPNRPRRSSAAGGQGVKRQRRGSLYTGASPGEVAEWLKALAC